MSDSSFRAHLGLLTADLSFPAAFSLKEKRRILRGLLDRLRSKESYSVAEIGYADTHTRSIIAVACVGSNRASVERWLQEAQRIIDRRDGLVVNDWWIEWL